MLVSKTLCFLFLVALATSTPLTEAEAQSFIQANGLVPPTATFESFMISPSGEKVIVMYKNGQAGYKFVIGKDEQGKPSLMFKEELLSIGFGGQAVEIEIMPEIILETMPIPMPMPLPVEMPTPFNQQFFGGRRNQMGNSRPGHRRFQNKNKQPCKLNEEEIKAQLKENLEIFKDAEIKEIRKVGFEFGTGLLLEIDLVHENKDYTIHAGYIPRHKKLNVVQIVEVKGEKKKMNPLETGKELIGKVISNMETPLKSVEKVGLKFENIIQSFVEKLLVRKNLKLGQNEEIEQDHPLVGSEGEPEMAIEMRAPILLGSEGEVERIEQQDEKNEDAEEYIFKEQTEEIHEHVEEKSEEISELVTEVLSKLKLKTK